jgi:probable F420-dependent oxidoreductase
MDFGLMFANTGPFASPEGATTIARAAEDAGFESVWTVEHVVVPAGYESTYPYSDTGRMPGSEATPISDPIVWLTWAAAQTTTLNVGTGILILPQRNPVVLAKACATLDVLSQGRLRLGVGVGWLEEEFDVIGVPFKGRGRRAEEYVAAMRALWDDETATFAGDEVSFTNAISRPGPVNGRVPVIVGGHSDAAAERAGRIGDGFFPGKGDNDRLREVLTIMRHAAEDAGRDPDAIEVTAGGAAAFAPDPVEALAELAEMGVSRVAIPPLSFRPDEVADRLGEFGDRVIAAVNAAT